jgi:hypothetical protein
MPRRGHAPRFGRRHGSIRELQLDSAKINLASVFVNQGAQDASGLLLRRPSPQPIKSQTDANK